MSNHPAVPYADPEPFAELIEECRCVEGECAAHGVPLHPEHHDATASHPAPVLIGEETRHLVDEYPDYGG